MRNDATLDRLPRYQRCENLRAAPIVGIDHYREDEPGAVLVALGGYRYRVTVPPAFWAAGSPPLGSYLVQRSDGTLGWCGRIAFERGARRVGSGEAA